MLLSSAVSAVLSSLQPEVELQEDSPEIYRLAPNLESLVVINSRLLSRLLSPGMDLDLALGGSGDTDCLRGVCSAAGACQRSLGICLGQFRSMDKFVLGAVQVNLSVHGWRPEMGKVCFSLCLGIFCYVYLCVG